MMVAGHRFPAPMVGHFDLAAGGEELMQRSAVPLGTQVVKPYK
jgi:hypothetical protein